MSEPEENLSASILLSRWLEDWTALASNSVYLEWRKEMHGRVRQAEVLAGSARTAEDHFRHQGALEALNELRSRFEDIFLMGNDQYREMLAREKRENDAENRAQDYSPPQRSSGTPPYSPV